MTAPTSSARVDARSRRVRHRAVRMAFFGFYGRDNFGDDLFGYLLQRICGRVEHVRPMLVGAPLRRELRAAWRWGLFSRWIGLPGRIGTLARFVTYCAALVRADVVAFGGGSLFGAHASLAFARLIAGWGAVARKPVIALGVSVGPFDAARRRKQFLDVVAKLDALAVRDNASLAGVRGAAAAPPALLGDLAFALPALYRPGIEHNGSRTLVIAVHLADYVEHVVAVLRDAECVRRFDRVRFVALDDASGRVTEAIRRSYEPPDLAIDEVRYADSIEAIVDVLASASCIVTSKLHGAITGNSYGVPVLLFCYQRKCADFLEARRLPGPRAVMPLPDDCVEVVRELSDERRDKTADTCYERAERHRRAFTDFIRRAAELHRP